MINSVSDRKAALSDESALETLIPLRIQVTQMIPDHSLPWI